MDRIIYLDNSATTAVSPEAAQAVTKALTENYGNPSSVHGLGIKAEQILKSSRQNIAAMLHVPAENLYFTSGGTEANNWAVKGLAYTFRKRGQHIITSAIEHASVLESCRQLEKEGFSVTYLPVSENGAVEPDTLRQALSPQTILVSIMSVNNELGSLQPLQEISEIIKTNSHALLHVDHVQGAGKIALNIRQLDIAALSLSSHKIHGPKGCGALYIKNRLRIQPLLSGGDQEKGLRGGTENVPGIAGFGKAAELAEKHFTQHSEKIYALKERLEKGIAEAIPCACFNSPSGRQGAPQIVNVSFPGIKAEVLVHMLEQYGIYISAGSACHSHRNSDSHVLRALSISDQRVKSAVRISLSALNTAEEMDLAVAAIKNCTDKLNMLYK